jgi:DNA repair exonuclease SbcCD ATPase subunit
MSSDRHQDNDPYLNLNAEDPGELTDKVQQVRAELEALKQKQEEIEREKSRLEELKRRQDALDEGRSEMLDKLTRALVVVHRETEESQKRVEQLSAIHHSFTQHLQQIDSISPRSWSPQNLSKELSRAISMVEDARADYNRSQAKLSVDTSGDAIANAAQGDYADLVDEERGLLYWVRAGFAFTLPLQIIGILVLLILIWSLTASK